MQKKNFFAILSLMQRKLLFSTTFLFLIVGFTTICLHQKPEKVFTVDTSSFTTIGHRFAPIHLILFEEFACDACKRFHQEDLPQIDAKYIEKGLAKLTIIPLAYFQNSENAFISSACMKEQESAHHKNFIDHVYTLDEKDLYNLSSKELLSSYASQHVNISLSSLMDCVRKSSINRVREEYQEIVDHIVEEDIEVPILLVNGKRVPHIELSEIFQKVDSEIDKIRAPRL